MAERSPNTALARRRRLVAFAIAGIGLGAIAALFSVCKPSLYPPGIEQRQLQQGAAVLHAAVKLPPDRRPVTQTAFETQARRATLIANSMASPPVLKRVGRLLGTDAEQIAATVELPESINLAFIEPENERRASQIRDAASPYRLNFQTRPNLPLLDVYAQAPSVERASRLADAAVSAANSYLGELAAVRGPQRGAPVRLARLGAPRAGPIDPTAPLKIAALTFVVVASIVFGLLFLLAQLRRGWLRAGTARPRATQAASGESAAVGRGRGHDDWPRTTRILPWMIAAFVVLLWLVPINAIAVQASLPIDLKLDRLVLPLIVATWLLSLAAGGPGAPRWRFTAIHAAVTVFVAVAFLSVVLNAIALNQSLELELAIKKLTLLAAFFSTFLAVASIVRPSEVRPFMTLMLVLGVVCAAGVLWEYRFGANLFYELSGKLLPGVFSVTAVDTSGFDEIGRRAVIGPADLSLEVVAMLSLALPIALVRLMQSDRRAERLLYGLAVCALLGATIATYRKSALLAPLTVCMVLAYFRRRELLRLAPLGLVFLLAVPVLAPNALGSIVDQFEPNRLGVSTVSDRVSDYDAVRPDLLSHPTFGRGYGSYDHSTYRILDNDLLVRIVETGVAGLAAYVLMIALTIATAAPIIRGRDPSRAPPALAVAAAGGAFLTLSVLFDLMSFPHGPYLFLVLAGLLATIAPDGIEAPTWRPRETALAVGR